MAAILAQAYHSSILWLLMVSAMAADPLEEGLLFEELVSAQADGASLGRL